MNKEELISKKDLLAQYAISYGALYRWKRMGLIPEAWFIKKSTVTGQETFFPKELVCQRVELIQKTKDDISLNELARRLTQKEKQTEALVLSTALGEQRLNICDIMQITLIREDGSSVDLTNAWLDLLRQERRK